MPSMNCSDPTARPRSQRDARPRANASIPRVGRAEERRRLRLRDEAGRRELGLKNAVYVLLEREACRESFEWARGEITARGGEATLLRSEVVEGLSDRAVEALFRSARDADYLDLAEQARTLKKPRRANDPARSVRSSGAWKSV